MRGYYAFLAPTLCLLRGRWILTGRSSPDGKNTYPSVVIRNECALPRRTLRALSRLNILRQHETHHPCLGTLRICSDIGELESKIYVLLSNLGRKCTKSRV